MTNLYSISLNLEGKNCIVIGGGQIAARKVKGLLECGAKVKVITNEACPALHSLSNAGQIELDLHPYQVGDIDGSFLVFCATNVEALNAQIAAECATKGILVNVVDASSLCSFFVPSTVRQGDLSISVSTGGKSPLLASKLKQELAEQFGPEYGQLLQIMGEVRERVLSDISQPHIRKKIYSCILESNVLELLKNGQHILAKERVEECISSLWD